MAELIIGILGLAPLVLIAQKSMEQKIQTLRDYAELSHLLKFRLTFQIHIFQNEWQLLLENAVQNPSRVAAMMDQPSAAYWTSSELRTELGKYLGRDCEACLHHMKSIYRSSKALDCQLEDFTAPDENNHKSQKYFESFSKARDRLVILKNGKRFAETLDHIEKDIVQLCGLLNQIRKLDKNRKKWEPICRIRPSPNSVFLATWAECQRMREASTNLHAGLAQAWGCYDSDHKKHLFNLFVHADESNDAIHLRLSILLNYQAKQHINFNTIQLKVWSKYIASMSVAAATGDEEQWTLRQAKLPLEDTSSPVSASSLLDPSSRFADEETSRQSSPDLRVAPDVCSKLTRETPSASPMDPSKQGRCCLGHIEASFKSRFRHTFYSGAVLAPNGQASTAPSTLLDMIRNKNVQLVDPLHKLWLARSVAMTMLRLHSTPWLHKLWQLRDLAMLVPDDIEDLSKSLETMHVNVEFAMGDIRASGSNQPAPHDTVTDEEILHSTSWPVWSLGVAFLQIDRWAVFDVKDVLTVRKTAKLPSSISRKFRILTVRCLDCRFEGDFDQDMSDPGLQKAVCKQVVGELDTLIKLTEEMSLIDPTDSEE